MQRPTSSSASLASFGPAVVTVAAMLWGTDALWRTDLLKTLPAPALVLWEHVILVLATGWLLWRDRDQLRCLPALAWGSVIIIGVGASAIATVLFSEAFRLASPTTVLLLQKTQPLIAISLAAVLLREPLPRRFWPLLPVALFGAYLITFGDTGPLSSIASADNRPLGILLTLGAAALWGAGTVLGRHLLRYVSFPTVTALRFAAALPALLVISLGSGFGVPSAGSLPELLALALVPGLIGLLLYYWGLRTTPAAVSTICELSFPLTAILLNWVALGTPIAPNQVAGIALLWGALAVMQTRPSPATEVATAPVVEMA